MLEQTVSRRKFLKVMAALAVEASLGGAGAVGYSRAIEPGWVEVNPVQLTLPRLPAAFHGYRIAQISDIHMDGWMTRDRLAAIVGLVNAQQPDLIAVTGDFVTGPATRAAQDLITTLRTLTARDGVVAVLGNHDHWSNAAIIRQVIQESGLRNLSNAVHTLERGRAHLHLAGVDDVWAEQDRLDLVLERLPATGAALLLAHEPDFADTSAATGRFDLQISGHSHGGQVVLPVLGPPRLPPLGEKYPTGQYQVGTMIQYTNRGVGMVRPHVRFNCRPEITVFTLESPAAR